MSATSRSTTPGLAAGLVLLWVQVYTAGLPGRSREQRIGQIVSDLWEHHSDRSLEGASPALIELEALGRAARGVAADLFWRFQLEGPQVQLNIPLERLGGGFLLVLVAAVMLSLNVSGYDPAVDGFDTELRRLAGISGWQTGLYTALQVLSGIGILAAAVVLYLALRRYSATQAILAAVALGAAGLIVMVNSTLYATAAGLADEYVAATPDHRDAVLTVARAFVLTLTTTVLVLAVMLALGVYGFAFIAARQHLVPGWLSFVAGGSVVAMLVAMMTDLMVDSDITWLSFIIFLGLLLLWLLVAGVWLLFGGSRETPDDESTATRDHPAALSVSVGGQPSSLSYWLVWPMVALFFGSLVVAALAGISFIIVIVPGLLVLLAGVAFARIRRPGLAP